MGGFGNAPAVQMLVSISSSLDTVIEKSEAARSSLETTQAKVSELTSGAASVDKAATGIEQRADKLAQSVTKSAQTLRDRLEQLDKMPAVLDDLLSRVRETTNAWSQEIELAIGAVKAGALSAQEFLTTWGDAVIQVDEGSRTLREIFSELDLGAKNREIQNLIKDFRTGAASLDDVSRFLAETGFVVADQLAEMINRFRAGEITLERMSQLIKFIEENFPDSGLSDLAEAVEDGLRKGTL